ncbi:hypothetical protein D3C78_1085640 [compost metagenome]
MIVFGQGSHVVKQPSQLAQSAVEHFSVGYGDEHPPARREKLSEASQNHQWIVHVLKDEAHHDYVKALVGAELLEPGLDDLSPAVRVFVAKVVDDCGRTFQHHVVLETAREDIRGIAVAQTQLK